MYSSKAESSALKSKAQAAMGPWGWFASPLGTVLPVVLLGVVFGFRCALWRCRLVPAGPCLSPHRGSSTVAASGETEAEHFWTLSG